MQPAETGDFGKANVTRKGTIMKNLPRGARLIMALLGVVVLALAPLAWANGNSTGSGSLTVNPGGTNGTCDAGGSGFNDLHPHDVSQSFWDVKQNDMNWLNITAGFKICKGGDPAAENQPCSNDNTCNTNAGQCQQPSPTCSASSPGGPKICGNSANDGASCTNSSGCTPLPKTCSVGSPVNVGGVCTTDNNCNYTTGACSVALECSGSTNVVISGHTGTACTQDADCIGAGEIACHLSCVGGGNDGKLCGTGNAQIDCPGGTCSDPGLCRFADQVAGTVAKQCTNNYSSCTSDANCSNGGKCVDQIQVCYATRSNTCATGDVSYCGNFLVNINEPAQSNAFKPVALRTVDNFDEMECTQDSECGPNGKCVGGNPKRCESPLNTATACVPPVTTCKNEVGSYCCSLTQGAYGSPNSVATAAGTPVDSNTCHNTAKGFIPAAICQGDDPFIGGSAPNGTTIGSFGSRSVTVLDLKTLQAYLPASGTAGPLTLDTNKVYSGGVITPPTNNISGSGSKGNGAGVLAGQTMACSINAFLSSATPAFGGGSSSFTAPGFGGFTLPAANALVCTKRSGSDKVLGNFDDICQAFAYPTCVAGKTVAQVQDCANQVLAGQSNDCACSAKDLNVALSNINVEFDQCGNVVACGSIVNAGVFACP